MKSMQETEIVRLSRSYLAASPDEKLRLEATLRKYDGLIEPVIQKLMNSQEKQWQRRTGVITAEHFTAPGLREEYKSVIRHNSEYVYIVLQGVR